MANYSSDRAFTDYIHQHLAIPKIYSPMGWKQMSMKTELVEKIDMHKGIDYFFEDKSGRPISVQERFREAKYIRFNDFTIRYRRDKNLHKERQASEYYKMKADYFVYGIANGQKLHHDTCTDFLKYAVIDLKRVYEKIDSGQIIIRNNQQNICSMENARMVCPIKYNTDGSSSFFPLDITILTKLWGMEIIVTQKGFI